MKKEAAFEKRGEVTAFISNARNTLLARHDGEEVTPELAETFRQEMRGMIKDAGYEDHVRDIVIDIKGTTSMFCTAKMAKLTWDEE